MLIVETIGRIRREHFVQGKSIKEIARTLKLSRNTVRKFFGLRTRRLPDGSGVGLSQKGHFYEGLFDWIEVRRIGRQEEELGLGVRVVNTATRAVVQVGKHGTRRARAAVDEFRIAGLDELARIPILTKEELRSLRPTVLLPQKMGGDIAIGRWTSGTSGLPTVNFWSTDDYAALVAVTARMLARQAPIACPSVFNAYSQAHMTGPLYHAALSRLGSVVFDRSHHAEEIFPTSAQAELFDFDTLVAPSKAVRGKGIGLQNSARRGR